MTVSHLLRESGISYTPYKGGTVLSPDAVTAWDSILLSDITYDSRRASCDKLFVCLPGVRADGHDYAPAAYDAGCRIFLAQRCLALPEDALVIVVTDTRAALPHLSDAFFGHPQRELTVIGITGTKGKTTVAHLTAAVLNASGIPCGTIGTVGITYGGKCYPTVNSTPESDVLHRTFRQMADSGIKAVVMEVSSLALVRHRTDGIRFDIAAFTNLTEDHISPVEHPDFEDYKNAKKRLFSICDFAVMRADDPHSAEFLASCECPFATFGFSPDADFRASDIAPWQHDNALGISFALHENAHKESVSHKETVSLRIPGTFNAQNALCVIGITRHLGFAYTDILPALARASVPGRFEILDVLDDCTVVLDYAHNGMSMKSLLETVRAYHPKRIVVLYGSIGGRAQHRRQELAETTGDLADYAVITSDNPDFEDPESIVNEIASYYTDDMCPHKVICDRREAVLFVLSIARPGDVLLFCGKGHETYQIVRGIHVPFSEKAIIEEMCAVMRRGVGAEIAEHTGVTVQE